MDKRYFWLKIWKKGKNTVDGRHNILHTDGIRNGGLLDDDHELVGDGGQDILHRLGQNDEPEILLLGQAQGAGRLSLTAIHGLEAGANDFAQVSAGVHAQSHYTG